MYVPTHFTADDGDVQDLLAAAGSADLVTATSAGLVATLVPFLYDPTVGEHAPCSATSRAKTRSGVARRWVRRW